MPAAKTVLVVIDHPNPASLTHAVAARFAEGAAEAGTRADICDLYAEAFDPRWSMADVEGAPQDIQAHQARIEASHALCLAFPLFWYGMPAMMKGWIDRVWSYGWAYDDTRSLLPPRPCTLLVPAGANPDSWTKDGFESAMQTIWGTGTMAYFGMADPQVHFLGGAHGSDARRAALLERAADAGRALVFPR